MGLAVIEMIRFHQPCIVYRIPAHLCHKEGTHSEFWDPSLPWARPCRWPSSWMGSRDNSLPSPFPTASLVGGWMAQAGWQKGVTERGQPAEKKGRQGQRLARLHFQTPELRLQILLHRMPPKTGCQKRERWLACSQTSSSSGLKEEERRKWYVRSLSWKLLLRQTPPRSNPLTPIKDSKAGHRKLRIFPETPKSCFFFKFLPLHRMFISWEPGLLHFIHRKLRKTSSLLFPLFSAGPFTPRVSLISTSSSPARNTKLLKVQDTRLRTASVQQKPFRTKLAQF